MAKNTKSEFENIAETGTQGLRLSDLYTSAQSGNEGAAAMIQGLYGRPKHRVTSNPESLTGPVIDEDQSWRDLGNSVYDDPYYFGGQPEDIAEERAQRQGWGTQLFNGVAKGVGLAATTFADGIAGMVAGIAQGTYNAINAKDGRGLREFSRGFFDNPVSNTLRDINKAMEEILPNYRTREEIDNPLHLSMNLIADDLLKNLGFTVGAFYSGNAYLGALRGLGKMSGVLQKAVGATISGINEGRIEAGNMFDEQKESIDRNIEADSIKLKREILASDMSDEEKKVRLAQVDQDKETLREQAYQRAADASSMDLLLNSLYLPMTNWATWGKLYARKGLPGSNLSRRVGQKAIDAAEEAANLEETMGSRIIRKGREYIAKPESMKKAALRGAKNFFVEGSEEMNQSFFSGISGRMFEPDSPDAYYKALHDREAIKDTENTWTNFANSLKETWNETYGGDANAWKEGLIGGITGLLGMPTFGRVANSDANTWLGRGKMIGFSGGLLGEIGISRQYNQEAQEAVDEMNKVAQKGKEVGRYFLRANHFTNVADGYDEEKDTWEKENAEDNWLYNAIDAFRRTGRMQDLREMVDEDFANITDEELDDIAKNTTKPGDDPKRSKQWLNDDGTLMSSDPAGRARMRQELEEKRKDIINQIDSYMESTQLVRSISNDSLTADQTAELGWLHWKQKRLNEKYKDLKKNNEGIFKNVGDALLELRDEIESGIDPDATKEDTDEKGNLTAHGILKGVNNLIKLVSYLQGSKDALQLSGRIKDNKELVEGLRDFLANTKDTYDTFSGKLGISFDQFNDFIDKLNDATRYASAVDKFNERFKEFSSDPIKLIQNREKIDKQEEEKHEAKRNKDIVDKISDSSVSELMKAASNGEIDLDEAAQILKDEPDSDEAAEALAKIDEVNNIEEDYDFLMQEVDKAEADDQAKADAKALIAKQKGLVDKAEDVGKTDDEVFNDINNLEGSDEVSSPDDIQALNNRLDNAKAVVANSKQKAQQRKKEKKSMQVDKTDDNPPSSGNETRNTSTGRDTAGTTPAATPQTEPQERINYQDEARKALASVGIDNPSQGTVDNTAKVLRAADSLHARGYSLREIGQDIKSNDYTQAVIDAIGINSLGHIIQQRFALATQPEQQQQREDRVDEGRDRIATPDLTGQELEGLLDEEYNRKDTSLASGPLNYWKPTITQYFIHAGRGEATKFITYAERSGRYTQQQIQRMKAVYDFLERTNAFENVNAGVVSINDPKNPPKVHFFTDAKINDDAGEVVIFMVDEQGRIIGDLGSKNDSATSRQVGLLDAIEKMEKEYKDAGSPELYSFPGFETTVLQNLVGKPRYTKSGERHTLNAIWEGKSFTLAISLEAGSDADIVVGSRKRNGTPDPKESLILKPLETKPGYPYVLIETTDPSVGRRYMCVPFLMPHLQESTQNSLLGKAVLEVLRKIEKGDWKEIKMPLMDLIEADVNVNYTSNGRVSIKVNKQVIYEGNKDDKNAPEQAFQRLLKLGVGFHISRKYINRSYINGQSYNTMIGELANTNLEIGGTRTTMEWFTVNPIGSKGSKIPSKGKNSSEGQPTMSPAAGQSMQSDGNKLIPFPQKGLYIAVIDGKIYQVDLSKNEVSTADGKTKIEKDASHILAKAHLMRRGVSLDSDEWYDVPVGLRTEYNPKRDKFRLQIPEEAKKNPITYQNKTYYIDGSHVYNEAGEEVFKENNEDRRRIYANYAVKQGRAKVITYNGTKYIVNNKGVIMSSDGNILDKNTLSTDDVNNILQLAKAAGLDVALPESSSSASDEDSAHKSEPEKPSGSNVDIAALREELIDEFELEDALVDALTDTQVEKLTSYPESIKSMIIQALTSKFSDGKFEEGTNVDAIINNTRFSKTSERSTSKRWNRKKEEGWMDKALPQLSTKERRIVHRGIIKIANTNEEAWGMFTQGIIIIASNAAKGTLYHEAFHAVTWTLLEDDEREKLFTAARTAYHSTDDLANEEKMAEAFRRYMQFEEIPIIGTFVRIFRNLKHIIQNLRGKEPYLNAVFYNISRGKYADRQANDRYNVNRVSSTNTEETGSYTPEMRAILANAPRDAQGRLLAPNGKPTKLSKRQYAQVRTKAFINWFGDWINDPENASKVVDKIGDDATFEPLVVYHGSPNYGFNIFSLETGDRMGRTTQGLSKKFYFTKDIQTAMQFALSDAELEELHNAGNPEEYKESGIEVSLDNLKRRVYSAFLNIKNPYNIDAEGKAVYQLTEKQREEINKAEGSIVTNALESLPPRLLELMPEAGKFLENPHTTDYIVSSSNQIKSATDNVGTFSADNPDIRYRKVEVTPEQQRFREDTERFLSNFGITINDLEEYDSEEPLFDALNKVINVTSTEDLTEATGYAIAFMMQYQRGMQNLLATEISFGKNQKGLRRGLKKESESKKSEDGFTIPFLSKGTNKQEALKKAGQEIAKELRKLYGFDKGEPSFFNKIWSVITEFFYMLTPKTRQTFEALRQYSKHIANAVYLNDKSIVLAGMTKPGTTEKAERVDIAKAFTENPYEEGIIRELSKHGIALAGSASMALNGTLYRPKENPLHDIDFQAADYTKEKLDALMDELHPHNEHIRTISKKEGETTETYLVMDREFSRREIRELQDNGKEKILYEILDKEGNKIGILDGSDLVLNEGVKGKLLDFFTGRGQSPYGYVSMEINGNRYLISDARNAITAKLAWLRLKDLWDYNRYIPNTRVVDVSDTEKENGRISRMVENASIVWGHPAIGKTTYIQHNKDKILEWDEEVNPKRDTFIKQQIDPNNSMNDAEYREAKQTYMRRWADHPEYIKFLTEEWSNLKERAKKEHKQIFASPLPLLNLFMSDFDLVVNLTNYEFMKRNQERGGSYYGSLSWKEGIDDTLLRVNPDKLVTTDMYFSEVMRDPVTSQAIIEQKKRDSLMYDNLSQEQKDYLEQRGVSIEDYAKLDDFAKEVLFECMA